jgi:serine/threonine protein kinase
MADETRRLDGKTTRLSEQAAKRLDETKRLDGKTTRLGEQATKRTTDAQQSPAPQKPPATKQLLPELALSPGTPLPGHYGRYRVVRRIGAGGEADVYLCEVDQQPDVKVAVKIYRDVGMNVEPDDKVLKKLRGMDHPDILKLLDYGRYTGSLEGRIFEVSEYAEGGHLEGRKYDEVFLTKTVIPQLVNALAYLHDNGIVHRDINPRNLFFRKTDNRDIVLGDFGLCSALSTGSSLKFSSRRGATFSYSAPELDTGMISGVEHQVFGIEVDYYASGMTLLALILGRDPFQNRAPVQIVFCKQQNEVPIPESCSARFRSLLCGLLHPERKKRWGLKQMRQWMKGEDVPVAEYVKPGPSFHYELGGKAAYTLPDLATLLRDNPDKAKERFIESDSIERALETYNQDLAASVRRLKKEAPSHNSALIGLVHTLNPDLPYRMRIGKEARTPEELARVIDTDRTTWAAGSEEMFDGSIIMWLRVTNQSARVQLWNQVAKRYAAPDQNDAGLEHFLHILNPKLPLPTLKVTPTVIEWDGIEGGSQKTGRLAISNSGRGFLSGSIDVPEPINGFAVSPNLFRLFPGESAAMFLSLDTAALDRGRTHKTWLRLASNAGKELRVPVSFRAVFPALSVFISCLPFAIVGAVLAFLYRAAVGGDSWWRTPLPDFKELWPQFGVFMVLPCVVIIAVVAYLLHRRAARSRHG